MKDLNIIEAQYVPGIWRLTDGVTVSMSVPTRHRLVRALNTSLDALRKTCPNATEQVTILTHLRDELVNTRFE